MALAEKITAKYEDTDPQLSKLVVPPAELEEIHDIDGVVIPITTPNFLGMISMGVRFLRKDEQFDIKDTYIRDVSLNGNGKTIPHDHRTDAMITRNPRTGIHELSRQSSAVYLDMLLLHLERREIAEKEEREFNDWNYTLADSHGTVYENVKIVNLLPAESESPTIQAEAVFEHPKTNNKKPKTSRIPLTSIAAMAPVRIKD
jgi:hypothetical protein